MSQELMAVSSLPPLAKLVAPWRGNGLQEDRLRLAHADIRSPEQGMAQFRAGHSAERANFRCVFWMEPKGRTKERALIRFVLSDEKRRIHRIVGTTLNDPAAARLLIGNWRAGYFMSGIRWELYEDRDLEELIAMGRFDQWDLLRDITADDLKRLKTESDITPHGNWDFDRLLFSRRCSVCGKKVGVNYELFNIDSAVCSECGNRPFLAPSIQNLLASIEHTMEDDGCSDACNTLTPVRDDLSFRLTTHLFEWLAHNGASIREVRTATNDRRTLARLVSLWTRTPMGRVLQPESEDTVKALVLSSADEATFTMYRAGCQKMARALEGKEPFTEAHRATASFVMNITRLLTQKQLSSGDVNAVDGDEIENE